MPIAPLGHSDVGNRIGVTYWLADNVTILNAVHDSGFKP